MIPNNPRALIADDLTGALDTGVHFLSDRANPPVVVLPERGAGAPGGAARVPEAPGLQIVDTESRHRSGAAAYDRVRRATEKLLQEGYTPFFKKIDSTLRGNVGMEIDAMLDVLQWPVAAVVAAVPATGRIVQNGECIVRGVPLHLSESGADELSPHTTSSVQEIVCAQSRRAGCLIDHRTVSQSADRLASELGTLAAGGAELLFFDSASNDDISRIISALANLDFPVLLVGAAGLAEALARAEGDGAERFAGAGGDGGRFAGADGDGAELLARFAAGRALIVAGSRMQTTAQQVARIADNVASVTHVSASSAAILGEPDRELRRVEGAARDSLGAGRHVVLRVAAAMGNAPKAYDLTSHAQAERVGEFLGACSNRIVRQSEVSLLVLTGGSTALAVINALGVPTLRLLGQVEAGVPLCEARLDDGQAVGIVTKAGGFGRVDVFERILSALDSSRTR